MKKQIIIISMLLAVVISLNAQQSEFPKLTGIYLGQKPPGKTPELFAPGIISVDENFEHSAAVFSPDGKEVFWCTNVNWYTDERRAGNLRLYTMKDVDGQWTVPQPAPFVKNIRVERPVFSPDGSRLYFECYSNPNHESDMDIYVVEREEKGNDIRRMVPITIFRQIYDRGD